MNDIPYNCLRKVKRHRKLQDVLLCFDVRLAMHNYYWTKHTAMQQCITTMHIYREVSVLIYTIVRRLHGYPCVPPTF